MTDFQIDILDALSDIVLWAKQAWCYFFGHRYGEWEDSVGNNSSLGRDRTCKRCNYFDYDSQALKKGK